MSKRSVLDYRLAKLGRSLVCALSGVILSLAVVIGSAPPVAADPVDDSYDQVIQIMHLGIPEYAYKGERMKDSAYAGTVIALTQTGKVYAWGNNMYGKVGVGTDCTIVEQGSTKITAEKKPPCYYDKPQDITKYFGEEKVIKLSSYEGYVAVAITESGKVYYWGWRYDWKKDEQHNKPHLDKSMSDIRVQGMNSDWPSIVWDNKTVYYLYNKGRPKDGLRSDDSYSYTSDQLSDEVVIREADFTNRSGNTQNYGAWALTSKNKLLMIRHDGTTYEATNETVAKHGGFKHIGFNYAIDNQGKMWAYYYSKTPAGLEDISAKMIGTIPAMRDFVGTKDMVLRSTDGHFYTINLGFVGKDGTLYNGKMYEPNDVTTAINKKKVRLFSGNIIVPAYFYIGKVPSLYDYSYVLEGSHHTVCTALSGAAETTVSTGGIHGGGGFETLQPVDGTYPATCVNVPQAAPPKPPEPGHQGGGNTNPTNPTQPTNPTNPTNPTQPTNPTNPTNPANPGQPAKPSQPSGNTSSGNNQARPNVPAANLPARSGSGQTKTTGTAKAPGAPNTGGDQTPSSGIGADEEDKIIQVLHLNNAGTFAAYVDSEDENVDWQSDSSYAGTVLALTQSGKVYAWGNNILGSVGTGAKCPLKGTIWYDYYAIKSPPCYYDKPQDLAKYFNGDKIIKLTTYSTNVVVAISDTDKVYYWGRESGWKEEWHYSTPTLDQSLSGKGIINLHAQKAYNQNTIYSLYNTYSSGPGQPTPSLTNGLYPEGDDKVDLSSTLGDASLREIDYNSGSYYNDKNSGLWFLTSKNRLYQSVEDSEEIVEAKADKLSERGGVKQIRNGYALDNQGKLWSYYRSKNGSHAHIYEADPLLTSPLPKLREFLGNTFERSLVVRDVNNHIYALSDRMFDDEGNPIPGVSYPDFKLKTTDITSLLSKKEIALFDGQIQLPEKNMHAADLFDYSYVTKEKPREVCSVFSGVAGRRSPIGELVGAPKRQSPRQPKVKGTLQPVNGTYPATCVSLTPPPAPDPVKPPVTPTKPPTPGVPSVPSLPGVPNTGLPY